MFAAQKFKSRFHFFKRIQLPLVKNGANDDDEDADLRTTKLDLSTVCSDQRLVQNINNAMIAASFVGYLASTMIRHQFYEVVLLNDANFVVPNTERLLAPYWNEVSGFFSSSM